MMPYPLLLALLAIAVILRIMPYSLRYYIPAPLLLILIGFAGSELLVSQGFDTGVRHDNFTWVSTYVFMPIFVFYTAITIHRQGFKKHFHSIVYLTLPGFLFTIGITASLLFLGIAHPTGFPWLAAFLTASVIASTQPQLIISLLTPLPYTKKLLSLLTSEGLISDVLSITLFNFLLMLALSPESTHHFAWAWQLAWSVGGGLAIGCCAAWLLNFLLYRPAPRSLQLSFTLVFVYLIYGLTQNLQASGIIAVVLLGLKASRHKFLLSYWKSHHTLATLILFLLLGVTITMDMFSARWLAMLIGIIAIVTARMINIYIGAPLFCRLHWMQPLKPYEKNILLLGAQRGAIAITLAFMIPTSIPYWWTIQSITFGVVLYTLLIQTPLAAWVIPRTEKPQI